MPARLARTRLLGFTLLELIVTVVVLGILAALAVPAFSAVIDRTKDEALTAELEALGRGIAALAAFDGELTEDTVGEFLAAEGSAADTYGASSRWTALPDGSTDTPSTPAIFVKAAGGYLGAATTVTHRDDPYVAYLLVGASGGAAALVDTSDGTWGEAGAHALCFYGLGTGCTVDQEAAASGSASSVGGPVGGGQTASYTVTVAASGSGSVTVTPERASYPEGSEVTLSATADTGWAFAGWSGDLAGSDNPLTFTVTADTSVTATFLQHATTVAGGTEALMLSSPDNGLTWREHQLPGAGMWIDVAYGNGTWVAVNYHSDEIAISSDGVVWERRTVPGGSGLLSVAYANGTWMIGGMNGTLLTSPDAVSWTQRSLPATNWVQGLAFGNGTWVALAGSSTQVLTSTNNGASWTARTVPEHGGMRDVEYAGGLWVAVGQNVTGKAPSLTSTDAVTWTARSFPAGTGHQYSLHVANGRWVAVGGQGTALTSTSGTSWTLMSIEPALSQGVTFSGGRWLTAGSDYHYVNGVQQPARPMWTSTNGTSWSAAATPIVYLASVAAR